MIDFVFVFFLIFGYKYGVLDTSFIVPFIILVSNYLLKYNLTNYKYSNFNIKPEFGLLIYLMLVLLVISLLSTIINYTNLVPEYIFKPIKVILIGFVVHIYIIIRKMDIHRALYILLFVCLSHSTVIYFQYILDILFDIKSFLYHPNLGKYSSYRKPGLASGFPTSGIISTVGAFLNFYFFYNKSRKIWIVLFSFSSLSVFLSARSSMYLYILLMPILMMYFSMYYNKIKPLIVLPSILIIVISFVVNSENKTLTGTKEKMFANIINYMETGSFHDYSTLHLVSDDHLSTPNDISTILIGNSLDKKSGFQPSDISFVRVLWSNGIFSLIIYVLSFFIVWYYSVKRLHDKPLKVLYFIIFFLVFVMLFKGPYLFSSIIGPMVLFLFLVSINNESISMLRIS